MNYIRNSVKATVDAYNGTVTLYQWDEKDPVLKSWMKAFPKTVQPKAKAPRPPKEEEEVENLPLPLLQRRQRQGQQLLRAAPL